MTREIVAIDYRRYPRASDRANEPDHQSRPLAGVRIVHVTPVYPPAIGGVGAVVHNLTKQLTAMTDAEVKVLFCDGAWREQNPKRVFDGLTEVLHIRTSRIWVAWAPRGLAKHLKDADIVHIHDPFFSAIALLVLFRASRTTKIVMSTHGGFFHTKRLRTLKKLYFNLGCRLIARCFAAVVAVSAQDYDVFRKISNRVKLIENGVEIDKFSQVPMSPIDIRCLYVGKLNHNKNIVRLIEVYLMVRGRRPQVSLDVVGEDSLGIWANEVESIIGDGGDVGVHYHGAVADDVVVALMASAKFYMLASSYEGFGISVVEAMAAGRIPIVNDIPAMRGLISDGETGFLVDFAHPEQAAARIIEIMDYPATRLEQVSISARRAAERFGWERAGRAHVELYERCLV
jgi:alpha-1,3-mannosyltransferase